MLVHRQATVLECKFEDMSVCRYISMQDCNFEDMLAYK